jgi:hypothetical protein
MKTKLLITIIILTGIIQAHAQVIRCGTTEYQAAMEAADPSIAAERLIKEETLRQIIENNPQNRTSAVVTIPVVFHILYNTTAQNISTNRIVDQVLALNQDYSRMNANAVNTRSMFLPVAANTQIQFCLAQQTPTGASTDGILRVATTTSTIPNNPNSVSAEWNHLKYLNIYVGNLGGGLLGYANLPPGSTGNDHVVILFSSVGGPNFPGTFVPYHLGRTLTHEVGHWLNLEHIFSGCGGSTNTTCATGGDKVCDTPPSNVSSFGCPTNTPNTCTETTPFPAPYTSDMVDMYENYMDYTDDACMNIFTSGQGTRMNSAITVYRSGLLSSLGCIPVGLNEISGKNLTIVPNPSNGIFELQFSSIPDGNISLSVTDVAGKQIMNKNYESTGLSTLSIDLSGYADGLYILRADTPAGYMLKKLVISKK